VKGKFGIKIFVMLIGACSYEKVGEYAVDFVSKTLKDRLGDVFDIRLIEIFSHESFSYKEIIEGMQQENLTTPIVMINGKIVQAGGKLYAGMLESEVKGLEMIQRASELLFDNKIET
jgi:disulfide oxidoreductase YuzD